MSQTHRNIGSKSSPGDQYDAQDDTPHPSLLAAQEKLSTRQAKRAAKAAERREKSEALRQEGNAFFRKGDYHSAVDRYDKAIRVHGRSVKPILLTNLAAAYLNLGKYYEASEAAEKALEGDPKSVKARYRRGMARKNMDMWRAAAIDFRIVLRLDPRYTEVKKELAYVEKCRRENRLLDEEDQNDDSEYELPGPDDDPELGQSLSESSDREHVGDGKPCKVYNHGECTQGHACPFSHAPDYESERDALGQNVCRYHLMGVCESGEGCSYSHCKDFLLQKGWWSTAEGTNKAKRIYEVQQKFNKAFIEHEMNRNSVNPETALQPGKFSKRKKKSARSQPKDAVAGGATQPIRTESEQSSLPTNFSVPGRMKYTSPKDDDSEVGDEEYRDGMFGFTGSEVEELFCHGVKPWDEEARDFLDALHDGYRKMDAFELHGEEF